MSENAPPAGPARLASRNAYRRYQERIASQVIVPSLARDGIALAGNRLLDVGCGTGGMMPVWRENGADPVGVDTDVARLKGLPEACVAGDVLSLPFADESFRIVVAHDCLEHVGETARALAEIARVLSPVGVAFVTFPPFFSAYGAHQHASPTFAKFFPFGHLLPARLWLALAGHGPYRKMFAKLSRLSMSRFERAVPAAGLRVRTRRAFLVRPEVALRWRVPAVPAPLVAAVPLLRELVVTGVFYLLQK